MVEDTSRQTETATQTGDLLDLVGALGASLQATTRASTPPRLPLVIGHGESFQSLAVPGATATVLQ